MRTRIKVCGFTDPEDVAAAVAAGIDAVGFNFHGASPRAVTPAQLPALLAPVPAFVTTVGLFVDAPEALIAEVLDAAPLSLLQFHGDEPEGACERWARPYIKVLRMHPALDVEAVLQTHRGAQGWLLDAWKAGVPGGTGERFDWSRIPRAQASRIVLAGGLDAANVGAAIKAVRPAAVDVSGGVESSPGRKDPARMAAFVAAVREADAALAAGPQQ